MYVFMISIGRKATKENKPMSPFRFGSQSNVTTNEAKAKSFSFSMRHKSNSMFVNCDPVIVASKPPIDVACHVTNSGNAGDDSSDSSDNEQDDKNKDTSHCDNKDSAIDEEQDVQLVTEDSSAMVMAGVSGATPQSQEVQHFKDLHADTVVTLTKHCEVWEKKADEMTSVATADNKDEDGMF